MPGKYPQVSQVDSVRCALRELAGHAALRCVGALWGIALPFTTVSQPLIFMEVCVQW
jgi:hypothetical protein